VLKDVDGFPSNVSGFSIFSRVVQGRSGLGPSAALAAVTPSATRRTRSCVVIWGLVSLGGEGERGCRKGRQGGSDGGPEGGPLEDWGGVEGGLPPCTPAGPGAGGLGLACRLSSSRRCLNSGVVCGGGAGGLVTEIAGRRSLLVGGAGANRRGLRRPRGGGGPVGTVATLVLGGLTGLRQACGSSGDGILVVGDPGRGIRVAIRRISSLACCNSPSILLTFLWWSAAHSSTLP